MRCPLGREARSRGGEEREVCGAHRAPASPSHGPTGRREGRLTPGLWHWASPPHPGQPPTQEPAEGSRGLENRQRSRVEGQSAGWKWQPAEGQLRPAGVHQARLWLASARSVAAAGGAAELRGGRRAPQQPFLHSPPWSTSNPSRAFSL